MSKDFLDICRSSSKSVFSTFIEVVLICVINSNDNGHPTFISNRKKDICVVSLMPQDSTKAD